MLTVAQGVGNVVGYAKHVGRVGALAVALGIGTAVITTPGVAWADDETTTSNVDNQTQAPSTDNTPNDTPGGGHESPESHVGTQDSTPTAGSGTAIGTNTGSGTSIGVGDGPDVTLNVQTVTTDEPVVKTPAVDPIVVTPTSPVVPPTPILPVVVDASLEISTNPAGADEVSPVINIVQQQGNSHTGNSSPVTNGSATLDTAPGLLPGDDVGHQSSLRTFVDQNLNANTANPLQGNVIRALIAPTLPAPTVPQPSLLETVIALPGTIISTVLNLVTQAFAPLIGPGAPADNPMLWAVLAFVRRQFGQGVADAAAPLAASVQTGQSVGGSLLRTTSAAPTALASTPTPIPDPNLYGSLAGYTAQPGLKEILHVAIHPWKTDSTPSVTTASDPATGSSSSFSSVTITRPVGDQSQDRVYVIRVLNDYKYFDDDILGVPADKRQVISIEEIAPEESVTVQLPRVQVFSYPNGPGGRRVIETEQTTDAFVAKFRYSAAEDVTPPTAPSITTTDRTTKTVDLVVSGGTDNVGIVAYKIFRDGGLITIIKPGDNYTDSRLTPNTTYRYTARAVDVAGNESPNSAPPLVVTTNSDPSADVTPPLPPGIVTIAHSTTTVGLLVSGGGDDVGVTAYGISRDGVIIGSVKPGDPYTDTGLTPNTTYSYTARAFDAAGNQSIDSAPIRVTTSPSVDGDQDDDGDGVPNRDDFDIVFPASLLYNEPDENNSALEANFENYITNISFIPGVNIFASGISGFVNFFQLINAIRSGDRQDILDEIHDLGADGLGLVLGAGKQPVIKVLFGPLLEGSTGV